ncbi:hypothetical protein UFOVP567_47 [uncultured Caudovirales phage]|uniref:Uncharacterized protein n=1 Tax=uncultured Caudovirales phage TaxID=2100421 RepID=A0A6J5MUE8_9CAUD|nr:hypothetical protein UFOVP567_47 [uncultured Caudovirales phage]
MTVSELIDLLSTLNPDSEVRLALQQNWPLAATIEAVTELDSQTDDLDEETDSESSLDEDSTSIVWLAAGPMPWSASPYAPSEAWSGRY